MNLNENIRVGVVFTEKNQPQPRWFIRQGRKYEVKEITYTWRSRDGDAACLHFSVSDGANVYQLSFNQKTLCWRLAEAGE